MKRCRKCQLDILDESTTCPLCHGVLKDEVKDEGEAVKNKANGYPEVVLTTDGYHILNRIMLFVSIIIVSLSVIANYALYNGMLWSVLSVGIVLYSFTIVRHAIIHGIHLSSKIMVQAVSSAIIVVLVDLVIGYRGWSINYIVPQIAIAANIGIFVLLIISKLDWKRFVLQLIGMGILGLIPLLLWGIGLVEHPLMSLIAAGISVLIVLFTVIFGDKSVKNEMIRRFHI